MALTKRVEVLFDPEKFRELELIARSKGETVGALVRRVLEQHCLGPTRASRQEAVERLLSMRTDITWEEAKKILEKDVGRRFEAP